MMKLFDTLTVLLPWIWAGATFFQGNTDRGINIMILAELWLIAMVLGQIYKANNKQYGSKN